MEYVFKEIINPASFLESFFQNILEEEKRYIEINASALSQEAQNDFLEIEAAIEDMIHD